MTPHCSVLNIFRLIFFFCVCVLFFFCCFKTGTQCERRDLVSLTAPSSMGDFRTGLNNVNKSFDSGPSC